MATKRPYSDVHPSRREQVPQASRKRQKPDNLGPKSFKKAHTVNDLKTRLRNVSRLLAREDDKLPAHIRIAKERELQSIEYELKETQEAEKKSKMIGKYHHIRFFERQKATRHLKKAKKALAASDTEMDQDQVQRMRADVDEAEVDVNYAIYYPLEKAYVSMYPKGQSKADEEEVNQVADRGDSEIRQLVKDCMRQGTLDALRDGKLTTIERVEDDSHTTGRMNGKSGRAAKIVKPTKIRTAPADDEDSDGGFFE